jgi:SAM-dependent methyltransferase
MMYMLRRINKKGRHGKDPSTKIDEPHDTHILESYITKAPSVQNILDIFNGEWSSSLPSSLGLNTTPGFAALFEDARIDWAEQIFMGFTNKNCLELGPLEAGHSYMLQKKGAAQITAIESNSRAFLKSLCIKEALGLHKVALMYGDFRAFFQESNELFDVIIASGVLYHMTDPLQLIKQMSLASDKLYIWTHYYDPEIINSKPELSSKFRNLERVERGGFIYDWIEQFYDAALHWNGFCGGSASSSRWLTRESIIDYLKVCGYNQIDISHETKYHPNGPSFSVCAQRI